MPTLSEEKEVKCPFYVSMNSHNILCEGITEDNTIKLIFTSPEKRKSYCIKCCRSNYKNCEIFKMLEKKYEE
jgi:hypothetical protein